MRACLHSGASAHARVCVCEFEYGHEYVNVRAQGFMFLLPSVTIKLKKA